jgi:hypothetical protein
MKARGRYDAAENSFDATPYLEGDLGISEDARLHGRIRVCLCLNK